MKQGRSFGAAILAALLILAGLNAVIAVAQDSTPATDECRETTAEENVDIVTSFYNHQLAYDTNPEVADLIHELLHDNYEVGIDRSAVGVEHDPATNDDDITGIAAFHEIFPGWTHTIDEIFSTDGKVAVVRTVTASQVSIDGEVITMEPPISFKGVSIFTIDCGLIVQQHVVLDLATLRAAISSQLAAGDDEG